MLNVGEFRGGLKSAPFLFTQNYWITVWHFVCRRLGSFEMRCCAVGWVLSDTWKRCSAFRMS